MATWANLTQEQRDVYLAWENSLRATCAEQARVNNHWDSLNQSYAAQIQAILVSLDNNTIVPKTTGLVGAQSLDSDAEAVAIMTQGQGILTNYNTAAIRQLWTKAAGAGNLIG